MNIDIIEFDRNRNLIVIDDAFTFSEVSGNYAETVSRKYSIYNSSDLEIQNLPSKRLGCPLEMNDPIISNIYSKERLEVFKDYIPQEKYYHWRSYMNLGIHSDPHKIHCDDFVPETGKTILVYMNRNWDLDWGGETTFYSDDRKKIKYVSQFVPGRIIIFDGSIPHSAKPQHFSAPPYRFTLASKFRIHENT